MSAKELEQSNIFINLYGGKYRELLAQIGKYRAISTRYRKRRGENGIIPGLDTVSREIVRAFELLPIRDQVFLLDDLKGTNLLTRPMGITNAPPGELEHKAIVRSILITSAQASREWQSSSRPHSMLQWRPVSG